MSAVVDAAVDVPTPAGWCWVCGYAPCCIEGLTHSPLNDVPKCPKSLGYFAVGPFGVWPDEAMFTPEQAAQFWDGVAERGQTEAYAVRWFS